MKRYNCIIIIKPLTNNDIQECQRVLLSNEFDWDTANNLFEIYSLEEEYRKSSNFRQHVDLF